jgi:tetratricopeptide (TPR) repeat protein
MGYRAAKFVRRHRGPVAATALALVAFVAGTIAIAWQARVARRERDEAKAQLSRANAVKDFMGFLLNAAAPTGQPYSVTDLLEQGEVVVDRLFADDILMRAEMLAAIGQQHMDGERFEKAAAVLTRALEVAEEAGDPRLRAQVLCPLALATVVTQNRATEAEKMIEAALRSLPDDERHALPRAECLRNRSKFGFLTDDGEAMVRDATSALALYEGSPEARRAAQIDARASLAYGYYLTRQSAKADTTFAAVIQELEKIGWDRTIVAADAWNNWSLVHYQGDIRKAVPMLRRSLELRRAVEGESVAPTFLFNYAGALYQIGRYAEAEPLLKETIRIARQRQHARIELDATMELADLYAEKGDLAAAEEQLAALEPRLTEKNFNALRKAHYAYSRGLIAFARGQSARAAELFTESNAQFESAKANFSLTVLAEVGLARALAATGDLTAAEAAARRALRLAESFVENGAPSYLVGRSLASLAEIQHARRQGDAARATLADALTHLQKTLGADHPATVDAGRLRYAAAIR